MAIEIQKGSFAQKALSAHLLCANVFNSGENVTLFLDSVGKIFFHEQSNKLKVNLYCTVQSEHTGSIRKLDDKGQIVTEVNDMGDEVPVIIKDQPYQDLDVSIGVKFSNKNIEDFETGDDPEFVLNLFNSGRYAQTIFGFLKATGEIENPSEITALKMSYEDLKALEGAEAKFKVVKKKFNKVYFELIPL